MDSKTYSIGELARLSGTPVRRIRFYSDRGLLPPSARTDTNYRLYTTIDVARLDLIRALRAAGIELSLIAKVISRRLPLTDVLSARLGILEREISVGLRMATAIRTTLSLPSPTEDDFRRVLKMMAVSNEAMDSEVRSFIEKICEGTSMNEKNRHRLFTWYSCELPENPSMKQLEMWQDIYKNLSNKNLIKSNNISFRDMYNSKYNWQEYFYKFSEIMIPIDEAWNNDVIPDSIYAKEIVRKRLKFDAMIRGSCEADVIEEALISFEYGRAGIRLQDLCSMMRGEEITDRSSNRPYEFWDWFNKTVMAIRDEASESKFARDGSILAKVPKPE